MLLPKQKFEKILDQLNFLKHNSKTQKTREGYYMLNRYVLYTEMIKFKYSFTQEKGLYYVYPCHAVLCFQDK